MVISIIILILCALLALVVLAQNPKGGGLAAGFTGAQQIGGVQRTADFLEKGTWTFAGLLMVLCLVSAGLQHEDNKDLNGLNSPSVDQTTEESAQPAEEQPGTDGEVPPAEEPPASEPAK